MAQQVYMNRLPYISTYDNKTCQEKFNTPVEPFSILTSGFR